MLLVASMLCYLNLWIHIKSNRDRAFSVKNLLLVVWGTVLLINFISPYGWNDMSFKTEMLVFIGSFVMNITILFSDTIYISAAQSNETIDKNSKNIKYFFRFQIILILLTLPIIIKAITILAQNNFDMMLLRRMYATGGTEGSYMTTFERMFNIHYVVQPLAYGCIVFDAYLCFVDGFYKKPMIYLVVISILVALFTAGRNVIMYSLIVLFVAFFSTRRFNLNKKMSGSFKKVLFLMVFVCVAITVFRGGNNEKNIFQTVIQTLCVYFGGGTRVLNETIINPSSYGLGTLSFGMCIFGGLLSIYSTLDRYILGAFGLNLIPRDFIINDYVQGYVSGYISIGENSKMNAFPTMFYYFMRDGGIVGLVFFTFIFTMVLIFAEKKFNASSNIKNFSIYAHLFHAGFMSVCWLETIREEFWMVIIWIIIIYNLFFKQKNQPKQGANVLN